MTAGQRIAQKRKELGLSQESLGEQLGVSRQAIYKWESDATLPEIEKLIALSRIFSVSVGWLLGVEEESAAGASPAEEPELTDAQVKMVEEIVNRYLAAQPAPAQPPKRRKWPFVLAGVVLVVVFVSLFSRLSELKDQYSSLQNSIYNVTTNVNRDIASITDRVEAVLKSQNELTADYGTELIGADLAANTVTFTLHATPKTYTEGMTALFVADTGNGQVQEFGIPAEEGGEDFSAQVTCELTDDITLSVVFITGDKRETQILETYGGLYSGSFPYVHTFFPLWFDVEGDVLKADGFSEIEMDIEAGKEFGDQQPEVISFRIGLFKDQKLVMWYEEEQRTTAVNGKSTLMTWYSRPEDVALERGSVYCEAVVAVDQFGRERVYMDTPIEFKENEGEWGQVNSYTGSSDPEGWEY